jgi:hypothetical protein
MADMLNEKPEGEVDSGDVLDLTEADRLPDQEEGGAGGDKPEGEDDFEVVALFGEEASPASTDDNATIRQMRDALREKDQRIKELERGSEAKAIELGPKPTLETCEYDEERLDQELDAWHDRKREVDAAKSEAQREADKAKERWNAKLGTYGQQKDKLPVKDFEAAEAEVLSALSPLQQSIIIQGAERKAELVYALGRHPEKLREIAAITDPVEFAWAAAKLEGQAKVERRPRTQPEGTVKGSAPLSGSTDKHLERLEKEASKPGADRTELIRYKKSKGLL